MKGTRSLLIHLKWLLMLNLILGFGINTSFAQINYNLSLIDSVSPTNDTLFVSYFIKQTSGSPLVLGGANFVLDLDTSVLNLRDAVILEQGRFSPSGVAGYDPMTLGISAFDSTIISFNVRDALFVPDPTDPVQSGADSSFVGTVAFPIIDCFGSTNLTWSNRTTIIDISGDDYTDSATVFDQTGILLRNTLADFSLLQADAIGDTARVRWPAIDNAFSYLISFDSGASYTPVGNVTSFDSTGISPGDTLYATVAAVPLLGTFCPDSGFSDTVQIVFCGISKPFSADTAFFCVDTLARLLAGTPDTFAFEWYLKGDPTILSTDSFYDVLFVDRDTSYIVKITDTTFGPGCFTFDTIFVTSFPDPSLVLDSSSDTLVCLGGNATLTVLPIPGFTAAQFSFDSGATFQPGPTASFTVFQDTTIFAVVESSDGCFSDAFPIFVEVDSVTGFTDRVTSPTARDTICANTPYTVQAFFDLGSPDTLGGYSFDDGLTFSDSTDSTFTISTAGDTLIVVRLRTSLGCISDSIPVYVHVTPTPTATLASASGSDSVCANTPFLARISFDAGFTPDTAGAYNFVDSTSPGVFVSADSLLFNGVTADTTIRFVVRDIFGCISDTLSQLITVVPEPIASIITAPDTSCGVSPISLVGDSTNSNGTVTWFSSGSGTFSDINLISTSYTPSTADSTLGSVTIYFAVDGILNCNQAIDSTFIELIGNPIIAPLDSDTVCGNEIYNLSASIISGLTDSTRWSIEIGSGSIGFSSILNTTYTPAPSDVGNFVQLVFTVFGRSNCLDPTDTLDLFIETPPSATIAGPEIDTVCANDSLLLTVSGFGDYLWTSNPGFNGTFSDVSTASTFYRAALADTGQIDTIIVTASTPSGKCVESRDTILLFIEPLKIINPAPVLPNYCLGDTVDLTATTANVNGIAWFSNLPGTFVPDSLSLITRFVPSIADPTYKIFIQSTDTSNCPDVIDSVEFVVNPIPTFTINPIPNDSVCPGDSIVVSIASASAGVEYSFDGGLSFQLDSFSTIGFSADTVVQVITRNIATGCVSELDSVELFLFSVPDLDASNVSAASSIVCINFPGQITIDTVGMGLLPGADSASFDSGQSFTDQFVFTTAPLLQQETFGVQIKTRNGCFSNIFPVTIDTSIVRGTATISDTSICTGEAITINTVLGPLFTLNPAGSYRFDTTGPYGTNADSTFTIFGDVTVDFVDTVIYYQFQDITGCESEIDSFVVRVYTTPLGTINAPTDSCFNDSIFVSINSTQGLLDNDSAYRLIYTFGGVTDTTAWQGDTDPDFTFDPNLFTSSPVNLRYEIRNVIGCTYLDSTTINVVNPPVGQYIINNRPSNTADTVCPFTDMTVRIFDLNGAIIQTQFDSISTLPGAWGAATDTAEITIPAITNDTTLIVFLRRGASPFCVSDDTLTINIVVDEPLLDSVGSSSDTICAGENVLVTIFPNPASTLSSAGAYSFDGGTTFTTSADSSFTITADTTILVAIRNAAGCISSQDSVRIGISSPTATANLVSDTVCNNSPILVRASLGAGFTLNPAGSYSINAAGPWQTNDTLIFPAASSDTTVTVFVRDIFGCITSQTLSQAVIPAAAGNLVLDTNLVCEGKKVVLSAITITSDPANLNVLPYSYDGGITWTDTIIDSLEVRSDSTVSVLLRTVDTTCITELQAPVIIAPDPSVFISTPAPVCRGQSVLLTALNTSPTFRYQWEFRENLSFPFTPVGGATSSILNVNPTVDGVEYRVRVFSGNPNDECSQISAPVSIDILELPAIVDIPVPTFCSNQPSFIINPTVAGDNLSYLWSTTSSGTFDDNTSATPTYTLNPGEAGPIEITLTLSNSCGSVTQTISTPILQAPGAIFAANPSVFSVGAFVTLSAINADTTAATYEWIIDGSPYANGSSTVYNFTSTNEVNVTLRASTPTCVSEYDTVLSPTNRQTVYVPNVFSPNANDFENRVVKVYGLNIQELEWVIYNRWGIVVYETSSVQEATSIGWEGALTNDQQELQNAVYTYTLIGKYFSGEEFKLVGNITMIR